MEYAMDKGVSLSTLRRYIKAEKLQHRLEAGRYLVFDDGVSVPRRGRMKNLSKKPAGGARYHGPASGAISKDTDQKVNQLQKNLQKAHEEIAELKMLIALYEEKMVQEP